MRPFYATVLLTALTLAGSPSSRAAAPPRRGLDPARQRRLDEQQALFSRSVAAGRFERAVEALQEGLRLRQRWQGPRHREALAYRFAVEDWRWLTKVPVKDRPAVLRGRALNARASGLLAQGMYREAERFCREALKGDRKVLGELHPYTADGYHKLASCLDALGQHARALPLHRKALAIRKKVLGVEHPDTATSYRNLARCLASQGQQGKALPLYQKALDIRKKVLGEEHLHTATASNDVALCLHHQGWHARALPLYQKALAIKKKVLGQEHPHTAMSYNNVAACLNDQGQHARALPLYQKALDIYKRVQGEGHSDTALIYNNMAACLNDQGQHAKALPLYQKALDIYKRVQGEEHRHTATCYNNVALCLDDQGQHARALPLLQKALDIRKKVLGQEHPHTAQSYNSLASCLDGLGKHAEALPLYRKALAIKQKVLGQKHSDTAASYNNLAFCLNAQGQHAKALPLYLEALDISKRALGEEHPRTATSYTNVALCLWRLDRIGEAARLLSASLPGQEVARFRKADSGFGRALAARQVSPHVLLALGWARLGWPGNAFAHAEAALARALLDDLAPADKNAAPLVALDSRLRRLDGRLLPLLGRAKLSAQEEKVRDTLLGEQRALRSRLARLAAASSSAGLLSRGDVQKHLPADAALVLWLDVAELGEHWACLLRAQGKPAWLALKGSGKDGAWAAQDEALPRHLYRLLSDPNAGSDRERRKLSDALRKQRLEPLRPLLKGKDGLPAVRHLLVVPTGWAARVPIEALAGEYRVSYVPSGSAFAHLRKGHRALSGKSLLALGDPTFAISRPERPLPPAKGVMLSYVRPAGNAAGAGLKSGDVLLEVGSTPIASLEDLKRALVGARRPVAVAYWREGKRARTHLEGAALGVRVDGRPAPQAVRAWREDGSDLLRGPDLKALPGTRQEVLTLAKKVPGSTVLLGSDASQQRLDELARSGKLRTYRLLHLATHGSVDWEQPDRSRLFLARDKLPDARAQAERARQGKTVYTGELTVEAIRDREKGWKLDADLVVLSACQTGLGKHAGGDGMLGFAQAFLSRGARCVVLSRWQVDDAATALLMLRFYDNLLGKKPLGRAAALEEARSWLRKLKRKQAEKLAGALALGKLSSTRGTVGPLPKGKGAKVPAGDHPYEHPYYWASFVLIGDPD
jgi:tetratricopeptide (TPR) repeat protein